MKVQPSCRAAWSYLVCLSVSAWLRRLSKYCCPSGLIRGLSSDFRDCGESDAVGLSGLGVVECVVSCGDVCSFEFGACEEVDVWVG